MRAHIRLPKTRLLAACLLLFSFFFIHQSCTKIDTGSHGLSQDPTEKFFNVPAGTEPQVLRIIDNLKQQNSRTGFIKDFAIKEGYPVWNRITAVLKPKSVANLTGAPSSAADTIICIPLVLENTQYVNSFIYARLNGSVHLRLYRGREYNLQGYDPAKTDNAQSLALQIMKLDKEVFGSKVFTVHDCRLFRDSSADTTLAQNKHRKLTLSVSSGSNLHYEYQVTTTCSYNWVMNDDPIHSGIFLSWGWEVTCQTATAAFLVADDDDDSPDFPPPTGGNGGGSGTNNPPSGPPVSVPCNPTPELENGLPPCEHGNTTGWTIVPEPDHVPTPCQVIDSLMTYTNYSLYYPYLKDSLGLNYEKGLALFDLFTPSYHAEAVNGVPGSLSGGANLVIPADAFIHTHYLDPKTLSVFSSDDIVNMITWFNDGRMKNVHTFTMGVITPYGSYIMMIEDPVKFKAFGDLFGEQIDDILYSGYNINENNTPAENEKRFLQALASLDAGTKVFRGNSDFTNFSPVKAAGSNGNTIVVPAPCN